MKKKDFFIRSSAVMLIVFLISFFGISAYADLTAPAAAPDTQITAEADVISDTDSPVLSDADALYGDYEDNIVPVDSSDQSSAPEKKNWVKIILIAVGIGLVVSVITVIIIASGYKNNGKTEPYEFKNKAPLELKDSEDVLVGVNVTSVHINRGDNN